MSEKKIVVPEGMLDAAMRASMEAGLGIGPSTELRVVLEAALRWQKENPPKPTDEDLWKIAGDHDHVRPLLTQEYCKEWIRRMYDSSEPEFDRIDFYTKTSDGRYVPWTPAEGQKHMMGFDDLMGLSPEADRRLIEAWNRAKTVYSTPEPCSYGTDVPDLRILNAVQDLIDRVPNDDIAQRCILTSFSRGKKAGSK